MMGEIFTSPARPFYQSTAIMELHPIDIGTYTKFIRKHFLIANKDITEETCTADKVSIAIENI